MADLEKYACVKLRRYDALCTDEALHSMTAAMERAYEDALAAGKTEREALISAEAAVSDAGAFLSGSLPADAVKLLRRLCLYAAASLFGSFLLTLPAVFSGMPVLNATYIGLAVLLLAAYAAMGKLRAPCIIRHYHREYFREILKRAFVIWALFFAVCAFCVTVACFWDTPLAENIALHGDPALRFLSYYLTPFSLICIPAAISFLPKCLKAAETGA